MQYIPADKKPSVKQQETSDKHTPHHHYNTKTSTKQVSTYQITLQDKKKRSCLEERA